jgi:tetratricopeptide (TPR) repeat protein
LSAKAQRYAARGDAALALTAYTEAIQTDRSFGPAYLGLGSLREALADYGEADRLYEMAAQLPEAAPEAHARRAGLHKRLGREVEALRELEIAVRLDPTAHARVRQLASWYAERQVWPAALAISRQLLNELERSSAPAEEIAAARIQVQALTVLAADADPVTSGNTHPSWVRRALSRAARRMMLGKLR